MALLSHSSEAMFGVALVAPLASPDSLDSTEADGADEAEGGDVGEAEGGDVDGGVDGGVGGGQQADLTAACLTLTLA